MTNTSSKLSYRAEIDGLRAIAVVSVILYHAQTFVYDRDWSEGGYIGVDIFFVISGYLITRIILLELYERDSFSFLNFYERRARRILPILFLVIIVSIPFAWETFLPLEMIEYSRSVLSSILFGSNFFFYFTSTEYGAESALLKPLLHTWSLGVEEQFYLVFPLLVVVIFRYFRKFFLSILVALSLLSLQFAELMEVINPALNFYLPFTRFWELAVGSVLAYRELNYRVERTDFWSKLLPMLGLYLITYSLFFFNGETPHPSFHTTLPIIGVALIIGFASEKELVGKVLGSKPFVWVGLVSYSAYMWHYPIFAFARLRDPWTPLSTYDKLELISLTFALSVLSFFLVERPFRRKLSRKVFFSVLTLVSIFVISSAAYVSFSNHFEAVWERIAPRSLVIPYKLIEDTRAKRPLVLSECRFNLIHEDDSFDVAESLAKCRQKFGRAVFILGDSHAINIFNIFGYSERFPFIVGSVKNGCRPHGCGSSGQYELFIDNVLPYAMEDDVVIFHQSGSHLVEDSKGKTDSMRAFNEGIFKIKHEYIKSIEVYLSRVSSKTAAKVFWLGPFIEYRYNPKQIVKRSVEGRSFEDLLVVHHNSRSIFNALEKVLSKLNGEGYTYIPFEHFYNVENNALTNDFNGGVCFQFMDIDHFSKCGEMLLGKRGQFDFVGF